MFSDPTVPGVPHPLTGHFREWLEHSLQPETLLHDKVIRLGRDLLDPRVANHIQSALAKMDEVKLASPTNGMGADVLGPTDLNTAPKAARQELLSIYHRM